MLEPTSFSRVASALRSRLAAEIDDLDETYITISHPSEVKPNKERHNLNLFFFRIEYGGYPSDASAEDPFGLRMQCLITAYGMGDSSPDNSGRIRQNISEGENDLRLIGEVMRVLHQSPIMVIEGDESTMHLQCVFLTMSLDDLNRIWSTQGDTPYRLSVAYEFGLVFIPLEERVRKGPLAGSLGIQVRPDLQQPLLPPQGFGVAAHTPEVPRAEVNVLRPDWAPHLCFLTNTQVLHYVLDLPDISAAVELEILVAGAEGAGVELLWETWDPSISGGKWQGPESDLVTPAPTIPIDDDPQNPLHANVIDPEHVDERMKYTVGLPFDRPSAEGARRQAVLFATRQWQRQEPNGGVTVLTARSNPLLVTVGPQEGTA